MQEYDRTSGPDRNGQPATMVHPGRIRMLCPRPVGAGPVVYWMHREHRWRDNWALLHARGLAAERGVPLVVAWALAPGFLEATLRQFGFLLRGLEQTARELTAMGVPFFLLRGDVPAEILALCGQLGAGALVTDFDPLRIKRAWLDRVARQLPVAAWEVDGRNVVPCWQASDKREYAARTIRPRIHRLLPEYLEEFPAFAPPPVAWGGPLPRADFGAALAGLEVDRTVPEVAWPLPGEAAGAAVLADFLARRLPGYATARNDPTQEGTSRISAFLHFGMLSSQRVALEVRRDARPETAEDRAAFLEQLIVRRELAENFCAHTPDYDTPACFPAWAQATLAKHAQDPRPALYAPQQFEQGQTHEPLWNAAQAQLVREGYMPGYLRMYWAKKILEWSATPEAAMAVAVRLNDRYQLDGRDPNGYAGIAWSLGGVHDRPWPERPVFGTIRFMSARGAASKFDAAAYVAAHGGGAVAEPGRLPFLKKKPR